MHYLPPQDDLRNELLQEQADIDELSASEASDDEDPQYATLACDVCGDGDDAALMLLCDRTLWRHIVTRVAYIKTHTIPRLRPGLPHLLCGAAERPVWQLVLRRVSRAHARATGAVRRDAPAHTTILNACCATHETRMTDAATRSLEGRRLGVHTPEAEAQRASVASTACAWLGGCCDTTIMCDHSLLV